MADLSKSLTPSELADLKAKAKAATPGEWRVGLLTNQEGEIGFVNAGDDCVARCDFGFSGLPAHANAKHIAAANPETILRLIDMIERRDAQIATLKDALISVSEIPHDINCPTLAQTGGACRCHVLIACEALSTTEKEPTDAG